MEVFFSKFAGLVLVGCLAGGAIPCYSQSGSEAGSPVVPVTVDAVAQGARKPAVSFDLTGSGATLKASLWAVHVLKRSSPEFITPDDIEKSSGFGITGPFSERSAGLRLEFIF